MLSCVIHLYSYRCYQILLSLSRNCVQASSYFVFVTAVPELGQTEGNQSEVWSCFISWSRKQVLRRGRMAKPQQCFF